jgi:uncharacterized protein (DUF983 family)
MSLFHQRMKAVCLQRCPHCLQGKVFDGSVSMRERCAVCAYKFEVEPGYFLGAMYVSYFLAVPVVALFSLVIHWLFLPSWKIGNVVLVAAVPFLLVVPTIFRYSRIIWMHFDHPWVPAADLSSSRPASQEDRGPQ